MEKIKPLINPIITNNNIIREPQYSTFFSSYRFLVFKIGNKTKLNDPHYHLKLYVIVHTHRISSHSLASLGKAQVC